MRTLHKTLASLGFLVMAAMGQLTACSNDAEDCTLTYEKCGGGIVIPLGCEKAPKDDPSVLKDECGVFVSATFGDDGGKGTSAKPFKTIGKAIAAQKGKIYVCADGDYAERVELTPGISLYGGLGCANGQWTYAGTKSAIKAPAPKEDEVQAALRVKGAGTSELQDLLIQAADAGFPGGSSIAMIVADATVSLARADLVAGNGATGATGMTPSDSVGPSDPTDTAVRGNDGKAACQGGANGNIGGAQKSNALCAESVGGSGGNGQEAMGTNASDGLPLPDPNPGGFGLGGAGQTNTQCKPGADGANGEPGSDGAGAQEDGGLSADKGYVSTQGGSGGKGTPGQGGGGGGGAKGKTNCFGASGGGGGAGGCGGNGGLGAFGGGSSIGLISLNGKLRFDTVNITTGQGGAGGDGGAGQTGGIGGNGGSGGLGDMSAPATTKACNGGAGGQGGPGGNGGGGRGGHSIGIAYTGAAPASDGATIKPGTPGAGGKGAGASGDGGMGTAQPTYQFK